MPDLKISELGAASATSGAELIAVVQGGTTKKASIIDLLGLTPSNGNLGLGVTPSAWRSDTRALQIGSVQALETYGSDQVLWRNVVRTSTGLQYLTTSFAQAFAMESDGTFKWYLAPSGTAGAAVSLAQAMALDASGLLVGRTTFQNNGTIEALGTGRQAFVAQVTNNGNSLFQGFNASGTATFYVTGSGDVFGTSVNSIGNTALPFYTNNAERARIKSTGQVRFVPLSADPSGAESGDVYYNSSTNKLKVYNGSSWVDLH